MKDKLRLAGIDGICLALKKINKLEEYITALAHKIDPDNAGQLLGRIDDLRRSGADADDIALRLQFHYGITEARLKEFRKDHAREFEKGAKKYTNNFLRAAAQELAK